MRIVVSCPKCCRRYDATGRRPGARFRCLCGDSLRVRAPRGHDASVVRCSSCGAPREKGAAACGFCCSDFTLHERDLHSVCPACFARVSDKARYCHHCATPMFAENMAGDKTDWHCPVCEPKRRLVSRQLGSYQIAVLECQQCAGLWLGMESLQAMLTAEARGEKRGIDAPLGTSTDSLRLGRGYRPCIVCGELMTRRNLARGKSGVVVDLCGYHGVWFDADELAQLIAWTRTGGLEELRQDLARMVGSNDRVRKRHALEEDRKKKPTRVVTRPAKSVVEPIADQDSQWITLLEMIANKLLTRR